MPAATPSFADIQKQLDTIVEAAEAKVTAAKNEERNARLRIVQVTKQAENAQDALREAQQAQADTEATITARTAEINSKITQSRETLDALLKDVETAKRRADNATADAEKYEGILQSLTLQKKNLEDDIATLTLEKATLTDGVAQARESKDKTLAQLSSSITQRSDELQALAVRLETEEVEHKRTIEQLVAAEQTLNSSIAKLSKQENELLAKNAVVSQEVTAKEQEVQNIMANLKARENEIEVRERAVKNKERSLATQMRRNLT